MKCPCLSFNYQTSNSVSVTITFFIRACLDYISFAQYMNYKKQMSYISRVHWKLVP